MKSLVRRYTAFQFFFSLLLWIPIYYEYQKRIGLNDPQIFAIQSFYYIAFCFLEIPTGVLADVFGFRGCLVAGGALLVIGNFIPIVTASQAAYTAFMIHFFLIALSRSLVSGASSAYLYEALLEKGASAAEYKKAEGDARAYSLVGKIALWPVASLLMSYWLPSPYVLTTAAALVSVVFAWSLPQLAEKSGEAARGGAKRATAFLSQLAPAAATVARSPVLFIVILQGIGVFVLSRIVQQNLFQPILESQGFATASYGTILSVTSIFEAIGSSSGWITRVGGGGATGRSGFAWVSALTLALAVSAIGMSVAGPVGTILGLMVFSLATGWVFPVQRQLMNDVISGAGVGRFRATLLSVESILDRAVCAWAIAWIGTLSGGGATQGHSWMIEFLQISGWVCAGFAVFIQLLAWSRIFDVDRAVRRSETL